MQISEVLFSFKGTRNYVHGTDIFNQIITYFPSKELTEINLTIHKMSHHNYARIFIDQSPDALKALDSPYVTASLKANGKKYWIAFLFYDTPEKMPTTEYNENRVTDFCKIENKKIKLLQASPYTFIETVIPMYKNLLESLYSNSGKWIFTKLILNSYQEQNAGITVSFCQNFNFKLVRANILLDDALTGELYFSLV